MAIGKPRANNGGPKGKNAPVRKSSTNMDSKSKKRSAPSEQDAKKSFLDQKVAKKQRRMQRPHYEMVSRAKEIWNIIRERDVEKAKRKALVEELFGIVQGKVYEIAAKHDASRVIQALLKYGTPDQRSATILELKDHMLELAKIQYGCFLVQKMIKYGSKADRALLVKEMTGHVVMLATHSTAANVLEFAQTYLQPGQLSGLKLEFYGKEFAYFKSESKKRLTEILAENPQKRTEVLANMASILNRMVDKQLLGLAFVQTLLFEYMSNATYQDALQMIASVRDASLAILATWNGARAVSLCLSLGTTKDRKRVIKCLKDKVVEATNHPSGYLVIMRILDVVDDTVTVQKSIMAELNDHLFDIAMHANGRKVLLQLLSPLNKKYLSPDLIELLQPPMIPSPDDATQEVVNYKKDPDARREELLRGLLPKLEDMCIANTEALFRSNIGRDVLVEVAKRSTNDALVQAIIAAVLSTDKTEQDQDQDEDMASLEPIYCDPIAHHALRRLIKETRVAPALLEATETSLATWTTTNRGSFVALSFLEAEHGSEEAKIILQRALNPSRKALTKAAKTQSGTKLLVAKLWS